MREAPSRTVIAALLRRGATIVAHDPAANDSARKALAQDLGDAPALLDRVYTTDAPMKAGERRRRAGDPDRLDIVQEPEFRLAQSCIEAAADIRRPQPVRPGDPRSGLRIHCDGSVRWPCVRVDPDFGALRSGNHGRPPPDNGAHVRGSLRSFDASRTARALAGACAGDAAGGARRTRRVRRTHLGTTADQSSSAYRGVGRLPTAAGAWRRDRLLRHHDPHRASVCRTCAGRKTLLCSKRILRR